MREGAPPIGHAAANMSCRHLLSEGTKASISRSFVWLLRSAGFIVRLVRYVSNLSVPEMSPMASARTSKWRRILSLIGVCGFIGFRMSLFQAHKYAFAHQPHVHLRCAAVLANERNSFADRVGVGHSCTARSLSGCDRTPTRSTTKRKIQFMRSQRYSWWL